MSSWKLTGLFLAVLLCPCCPAAAESGGTSPGGSAGAHPGADLKARYDSEEGFSEMVTSGDRNYRAVLMHFRSREKLFFSLYTPRAAAGKTRAKGLLREVKNPASQYPGSSAFNEKTGIAPDSSFTASGSLGMRLDAGEHFSVFSEEGITDNSHLAWSGILTGMNRGRTFGLNLAAARYRERDDSVRDLWYTERKTGYGREVSCLALSLSAAGSFAGTGATAAVTSGEGMKNGFFYRLSPWIRLSFARLDLLSAGTNSCFVKPDGNLASTEMRNGISLSVNPLRYTELKAGYVTDFLHEKESDLQYSGFREEFFSSLSIEPWFLTGGAFYRKRNVFTGGHSENITDAGFSAGIKSRSCRMVLERKNSFLDSVPASETWRLEAGKRGRYADIYILGKIARQKTTEKSLKTSLRVKGSTLSISGEHSLLVREELSGKQTAAETAYSVMLETRF